jgi:hypothetical protein
MGLKIVKGQERAPVKAVMYGPEGIGKTTLATQAPKPLILDTERGSKRIECDRVHCKSLADLEGAILSLSRDAEGYQTIVIDSADWAERFAIDSMLRKDKKDSIEAYGFGKGHVMLGERMAALLTLCDQLIDRGLNVVWVAHAKVVRVSPPDETDGYDRWELKLSKAVSPLFKEWADLLLFLNYRTALVEGEDGRTKGRGGKERAMHAQRCAAWDAKNRFGLPETMPLAIKPLLPVFQAVDAVAVEVEEHEEPLHERMAAFIASAKDLRTLGKMGDKIDAYESDQQLTTDQAERLRSAVQSRHNEIEPPVAGEPWASEEVGDAVAR